MTPSVVATPPDEELRPLTSLRACPDPRCPECGTLLDAPRVRPGTSARERKCPGCHDWHPVAELAPH